MSETHDNFKNIQNLRDTCPDLSTKTKIQKEWSKTPHQNYIGEVLHGYLHGHGFYFVEEGDKLFYDGLFYANKLEGYAQVFYNNGSNFQGLFKNNVRFGPGVFTYPNGEQDVGLWSGQRLLRMASLNMHNVMPRLATTPNGQLKLLKYRYLVPVCPKRVDVAYDILQRLGASDNVLQRSYKLYNLEVGNKDNVFFNIKLFNDQFYDDQDFSIEVVLNDEEEEPLSNDSHTETQKSTDLNVNANRISQITEEIEIIENKLKEVKEKRTEVEEKVEFCKACCYQRQTREESPTVPEEVFENYEPDADQRSIESGLSFFAGTPVAPKTGFINPQEQQSVSLAIEDIDTDKLFITEEELSSFISLDSDAPNQSDDLHESDTDVMSQIKNYLIDTCGCNEGMYVDNLYLLEKELEALIKDELFFESITNNLKVKLEKHLRQSQEAKKVKTKKISVNYVLSWNNEKYCIRMLKQSFLHRKSEYMVNFKVSDIIAGHRNAFGKPGQRERHCEEFLSACSNGDIQAIYGYIKKNDIDVNVCDSKGNNGVFFAAKYNHVDVIKVLVTLGAKLDQENDEGLLPLSMCLLILLARKHNVENWQESFLPDIEPFREREEPYKWYSNMSLVDMLVRNQASPTPSRKTLKGKNNAKAADAKSYLFDTSFVYPSHEKPKKVKEILPQKKMSFAPPVDKDAQLIENTIRTLLKFGANPNAGEAPLPPLFLSLFTEEPSIVENILEAHADVQTTIENDMSCLHVIASLQCTRANVCICHLLISYDCDPRLKASPNHWKKQKLNILGKHVHSSVVEDHGKNPLHILCIRRDFTMDHCSYFHDMVMNFRDSFIDFNDRYLGHTPLSLAVLVGNKNLVDALMKLRIIDPHQVLDYNMGNVLTIYTLKRYEDMIPPNAQEILDHLVEMGGNVLTPVGEFENSIEFIEKEHTVFGRKRKKSVQTEDKTKQISQNAVVDYMVVLGREAILKCIQLLTVENLYNLIENDFVGHNCVSILAKYLTPSQVITNLQLLFNHGRIEPERFDINTCLRLINIVKTTPKKETAGPVWDATDYGYILNMTDFTKLEKEKGKLKLPLPGLDDISKYKVCFHCLQSRDKDLIVCPMCQLVHFCSVSCNKENLRLNLHPCNTEFYKSELTSTNSPNPFLDPENLAEFFQRIREDCERRRLEKLEETLELQRKQFEEEMKSDTYGTKLLKYKLARAALHKTPTLDSLLGSLRITKSENYDRDIAESVITEKMYSGSLRRDLPSKEQLKKPGSDRKQYDSLKKLDHKKACKKRGLNCKCEECTKCKKEDKIQIECKCRSPNKKTRIHINTVNEAEDMDIALKKLRVIPQKCQDFIKLLTKHFPETDFSSLLLPYACYSNGHLYYNFLDDHYSRTYSMM